MHTPVLLKEAVENLSVHEGGKYIDATLGEGGHTAEIVKLGGQVLGIDWDEKQIKNFESRGFKQKITVINGNYRDIEQIAKDADFIPVDGVLFDLGLSMAQLSDGTKGFSFKKEDENLDMRIGNESEETASDLLNSLNEDELYNIFAKYSEDLDSRVIAHEIVVARITESHRASIYLR